MTKASVLFKKGKFVTVNYKLLPDGSREISIMTRRGKSGKFRVKNLYEKDEKILEDEEMEVNES